MIRLTADAAEKKVLMANAGGNTLATSGFKFRPTGRKAIREFSPNLVAIVNLVGQRCSAAQIEEEVTAARQRSLTECEEIL